MLSFIKVVYRLLTICCQVLQSPWIWLTITARFYCYFFFLIDKAVFFFINFILKQIFLELTFKILGWIKRVIKSVYVLRNISDNFSIGKVLIANLFIFQCNDIEETWFKFFKIIFNLNLKFWLFDYYLFSHQSLLI